MGKANRGVTGVKCECTHPTANAFHHKNKLKFKCTHPTANAFNYKTQGILNPIFQRTINMKLSFNGSDITLKLQTHSPHNICGELITNMMRSIMIDISG